MSTAFEILVDRLEESLIGVIMSSRLFTFSGKCGAPGEGLDYTEE